MRIRLKVDDVYFEQNLCIPDALFTYFVIFSNFLMEIFLFNLANITELVIIQLKFSNHIADLPRLQCIT